MRGLRARSASPAAASAERRPPPPPPPPPPAQRHEVTLVLDDDNRRDAARFRRALEAVADELGAAPTTLGNFRASDVDRVERAFKAARDALDDAAEQGRP